MKNVVLLLIGAGWLLSSTPALGESKDCVSVVAGALDAYRNKDFVKAKAAATEGISLCKDKAREEQKKPLGLGVWIVPASTSGSRSSPKTADENSAVSVGWPELNAVGAAHYIRAEIFRNEGKSEEAKKEYQIIIGQYPDSYQQGYQGWFWKLSELARDAIGVMGTGYDYGDYQASTLIKKGWEAFYKRDYFGSRIYVNKCLRLYDSPELNYKNESAIAHFLQGKIFLINKDTKLAREEFQKVVDRYPVTTYPNIKNYPYFNNITSQARDYTLLIGTPYDFGNYSSETLTIKAWKSWDQGDYKGVELYANKCIELWGPQAREMQKHMTEYAKGNFIPYFWAVNDVGTCTFILGMTYQKNNNIVKARQMYEAILKDYAFAQCWDPEGHYWKVAEVSRMNLVAIDKAHP